MIFSTCDQSLEILMKTKKGFESAENKEYAKRREGRLEDHKLLEQRVYLTCTHGRARDRA